MTYNIDTRIEKGALFKRPTITIFYEDGCVTTPEESLLDMLLKEITVVRDMDGIDAARGFSKELYAALHSTLVEFDEAGDALIEKSECEGPANDQ